MGYQLADGAYRILLLIYLFGWCHGQDGIKLWVPNTNFETGSNWAAGRPPCANDRARFPPTVGAVYVQTNTTLSELVLPLTGELVLGNFVSLSFPVTQTPTPDCPLGGEVQFTRTDARSWFDPQDWCSATDANADCSADQPGRLVSEQIPCRTDTVSFRPQRSFLVGLGVATDIYTGTLLLDGKSYTTATFKSFLDSEEGRRQFVRDAGSPVTTITILGEQCTDQSGCACGNDRGTILEKVCSSLAGRCEKTLQCTVAIRPMGACCDICGAIMKLDIGSNFKKLDVENLILARYIHGQTKYKDVNSIVSKTSLGQIQIVLTDSGGGEMAAEVADLVRKDLTSDPKYDVSHISIELSQSSKPTPAGQTGGLEAGGVAGVILGVFAVAIIVAVILFFVIGKRKRPSLPIDLNFDSIKTTIRNFGRDSGSGDLELGTVSYKNTPGGAEDLSYGFDNPMYGESGAVKDLSAATDAARGPVPVKLETVADNSSSFSNPLYGSSPIQVDFQPLGEPESDKKESPSPKKAEKLTYPDATAGGFSNPLYSTPVQEVSSNPTPPGATTGGTGGTISVRSDDSAVLVLNPVYGPDGVDEDSTL